MHSMILFAYLVSSICFILALRGLSSPETARQGNRLGMAGMGIAIVATLLLPQVANLWAILLAVALGGAIGATVALKIKMTALPQLVAAFHSLVGLAATLVAVAAFLAPESYNIGTAGSIHASSLIEIALGAAIGAVTFTGSLVAFSKLQGLVSGKPLMLPMRHMINLVLGGIVVFSTVWLCLGQSPWALWFLLAASLALGVLLVVPIGGADMPVVVSMLNSYSGWRRRPPALPSITSC